MSDLKSLKGHKEIQSNELPEGINNIYDNFSNPNFLSSPRLNSDLKNNLKAFAGFETERRRYARYQVPQEVTCTFYDSFRDDFEILDARVVNKSKSGLLLTTDLPLEIGMPVLVRLKHFTETDAQDELKDGVHAKVLKCDNIFVTEKESCYRVAIKHFELCQ